MRERCPRCNLKLEPEEGAFLGALALNYGVTGLIFIALLVTWVVLTVPDVPIVPLTIAAVAVTVVVPFVFFPFSKTIWLAIDLMLHRVDPSDANSIARTFGLDDPRKT